jgi:hypothetical protein
VRTPPPSGDHTIAPTPSLAAVGSSSVSAALLGAACLGAERNQWGDALRDRTLGLIFDGLRAHGRDGHVLTAIESRSLNSDA